MEKINPGGTEGKKRDSRNLPEPGKLKNCHIKYHK